MYANFKEIDTNSNRTCYQADPPRSARLDPFAAPSRTFIICMFPDEDSGRIFIAGLTFILTFADEPTRGVSFANELAVPLVGEVKLIQAEYQEEPHLEMKEASIV